MDPSIKVDVILPAGGRIGGAFAEAAGVEIKALIRVGGKSVLQHTIDILRASGRVGRIVVIGSKPELGDETDGADAVIAEGATGPENVYKGLGWLGEQPAPAARALVLTTDLPYLTPETITGLLDRCPDNGDICVPGVTRAELEAAFPGAPTIWTQLAGEEWTMGCGFVVSPAALLAARPRVEQVFDARKSQLKMVALLGIGFVIRFALRRLTVDEIVDRCSKLLGCRAVVVRGAPPGLAMDLDEPADYEFACRRMAGCAQ